LRGGAGYVAAGVSRAVRWRPFPVLPANLYPLVRGGYDILHPRRREISRAAVNHLLCDFVKHFGYTYSSILLGPGPMPETVEEFFDRSKGIPVSEPIIDQSLAQQVRRNLASIKPLRSAWHFVKALRCEMQWRTYNQSQYTAYITTHADDLWGYSSDASGFNERRWIAATEMLHEVGRNFDRVLEIGCAQGAMTERLAPLCKQLIAVDFVSVALERARARCHGSNICFRLWNLKVDPVPGQFDLIIITGVLGSFGGRRDIRRARDKLVNALTPGGYLLYGDYVGDGVTQRIHDSWLGRLLLLRPGNILRIIAAHPALVQVAQQNTGRDLLALLHKRVSA
jgi:SAM-dependent methyltransferase